MVRFTLGIIVGLLLLPAVAVFASSDPAVHLYFEGQKWLIDIQATGNYEVRVNGVTIVNSSTQPPFSQNPLLEAAPLTMPGECQELYVDQSQVTTPDPRWICKVSDVKFVDKGSACGDDTPAFTVWVFALVNGQKDPPVQSIGRNLEGDGRNAYPLVMSKPVDLKVPFGVLEVNGRYYGAGQIVHMDSGTWRCKTPAAMKVTLG